MPRVSSPRDPCQVRGCLNTTNGGKAYCLEHIDRMPYVVAMEEELP
jgi:hypothetical protein